LPKILGVPLTPRNNRAGPSGKEIFRGVSQIMWKMLYLAIVGSALQIQVLLFTVHAVL